jgi:hypothetical protein
MSTEKTRTVRRFLKWTLAGIITGGVIAGLVVAYVQGHEEAVAEALQEHPPAAPSRVGTSAGETFITLDEKTQAASGIETRALRATTQRQEYRANAIVLSIQSLTQLRTNYLSDLAQVDKAKTALEVSEPEYERLKRLYEDNQNAAAKTVQAAEGTWHSDQVTLRAANEALQMNDTLARQSWGEVVAKWISDGSPTLDRILMQKDLLVQVSFAGRSSAAPPRASIQLPSGKTQPAEFISSYPSVDPRVQSASFLYLAEDTLELTPGMTLSVLVPTGPSERGVIIPGSATVWWQGKAWTYVQTAPQRFARREVPTDWPVSEGWFTPSGFKAGEKVVIRGGQQLLSEEFRTQIQSLGEEGEQ